MKRKPNNPPPGQSIWDLDAQAESGEGLNPVAVEILRRGIKGITPLIPLWAEGVEMPIADISMAFEAYFNLWDEAVAQHIASPEKRKKERERVAFCRAKVRELLMPLDGGLMRLSNAERFS